MVKKISTISPRIPHNHDFLFMLLTRYICSLYKARLVNLWSIERLLESVRWLYTCHRHIEIDACRHELCRLLLIFFDRIEPSSLYFSYKTFIRKNKNNITTTTPTTNRERIILIPVLCLPGSVVIAWRIFTSPAHNNLSVAYTSILLISLLFLLPLHFPFSCIFIFIHMAAMRENERYFLFALMPFLVLSLCHAPFFVPNLILCIFLCYTHNRLLARPCFNIPKFCFIYLSDDSICAGSICCQRQAPVFLCYNLVHVFHCHWLRTHVQTEYLISSPCQALWQKVEKQQRGKRNFYILQRK